MGHQVYLASARARRVGVDGQAHVDAAARIGLGSKACERVGA